MDNTPRQDSKTPLIKAIEPFVIPYVETNDHNSTRWVCLVKVTDGDDFVGWGEAVTLFQEVAQATATLISGWREHLLKLAADTRSLDVFFQERTWWYGDSGLARFAMSALDIAIWDIVALRAKMPLSDLLGRVTPSVPFLISAHVTTQNLAQAAEDLAVTVSAHNAIGVKAALGKSGEAQLGQNHDRDVQFVSMLRAALGEEPKIMIDVAAKIHWTPPEAAKRILAFEEFNIVWTEEPLGADNPEGYSYLRKRVTSQLAYGEREWSPRGYKKIAASGTLDLAGIDPGRVGGITGFQRSANAITEAGLLGNAHAFSGPIIYAAAVALSLSNKSFQQLEITPYLNSLYELMTYVEPPRVTCASASTKPGLGVIINETEIRHLATNS